MSRRIVESVSYRAGHRKPGIDKFSRRLARLAARLSDRNPRGQQRKRHVP